MARSRTLTGLIADVRDRADAENSEHVSDAQVTRYINQSIAALYALIVEQDESDFVEEATFTATAGAASSTILTEPGEGEIVYPYKILAVDVIDDSGLSWPVPRFMMGERAGLNIQDGQWGVITTTAYQWRGDKDIYWAPPWGSDKTIRVTYVPSPTDLSSGSDPYDGRAGWEEWITLDSAIKVLAKEESDVTDLVRERALVEQRILKQIVARDRAQPKRVRDVVGGDRW